MPRRTRRGPARADSRPEGSTALVLVGRALLRGKLQPVEVAIDDVGVIRKIGRSVPGTPRHDVGDAVILPAATDLHVHFREPGGPAEAETIASGTVGAALGGIGLVGDMPNTRPPVTDEERYESKSRLVTGRSAVDVLLYASTIAPRALGPLSRRAGGFKLYLSPTTGVEATPALSELPELWERLAPLGLPVAVHAEDPTRFAISEGPGSPAAWNAQRPVSAENSALEALVRAPDALRLHAAHVTTAVGANLLRAAGRSFEATPHHLLLSEGSGTDARFKVNPPLRSEPERSALWEEFRNGRVPMLASDHAPHPLEAKLVPFDRAPSGVPGVETMLPLMLAKVRAGELDLGVLLSAACDRPARWLGQPQGRLSVGHRANLLVVDFTRRSAVRGKVLRSPSGWSPFEGHEVVRPVEHYRDGERIVESGEYVGRPVGRIVRPEYAPGEVAARLG